MRPTFAILWFGVASVLALGCGGAKEDRPPEPIVEPNTLEGRLAAAQSIPAGAGRDEALVKVANAATAEADVPIVEKALRSIRNASLKDKTAHDIALKLAKEGHNDGALDVAKSISAAELREETLKAINKAQ